METIGPNSITPYHKEVSCRDRTEKIIWVLGSNIVHVRIIVAHRVLSMHQVKDRDRKA